MFCLDYSADDPAMNLALDEALLEETEANQAGECLRFWESPSNFVVVGLTQAVDDVVHRDRCEADNVPILRRCSAGGCVLQGPGCLNFALVLDTHRDTELSTIRGSYNRILGGIAESLANHGLHAAPEGISDMVVDGLKFSGNAQRRKKRHILHHGTILYNFKLDGLSHYLKEPQVRPDYRANRHHGAFVANIEITANTLKSSFLNCFTTTETINETPSNILALAESLQREKYSDPSWNLKT